MVAWLRTGDWRIRLGLGIAAAAVAAGALWVLAAPRADPTSPTAAQRWRARPVVVGLDVRALHRPLHLTG
jgi:hypothetical protein